MKLRIWIPAVVLLLLSCSREQAPVVREWIELKTKETTQLEKKFKTAGQGVGQVSWWAGGYIYAGGSFSIELIDVKKRQTILKKEYRYGDVTSGKSEAPRFHWWHAEEKDRIILQAGRVYKMTLKTTNLGQPGAGWGMWLYTIGEEPKRNQ
ncbi:MAG: hypothetical protein EHM72_12115 [Calditrichaeota bacterium]|nr:MAG: hypothetical protein EHM72_12115 [Calditrichota bacterium]